MHLTRTCIHNWDHNRQQPASKYVPAILRFLGFQPKLNNEAWAGRLLAGRARQGLTRAQAAFKMGVDASTLAAWESGEREPTRGYAHRAQRSLDAGESECQLTCDSH